ncbi:penicillin-binding protein 2 [Candidatus Gottesmanbacteria bacterium]|nr:penicillin-binding protein 2 [Candidatus Gottesmanbacteria bacterium]
MFRMWLIFSLFALLFCFISLRLFYWQVIAGDRLKARAASQYSAEFILPASRGKILASDSSPLVINQPAFLAYAEPKKIKNISHFLSSVHTVLGANETDIDGLLADEERSWVLLAHKVELPVVEKLKALGLSGLGFEKEPKRYYPEASMAAHVLGFVGSDENGRDKGYFGLEGYYDRDLRGKDGVVELEKDARGMPILIGEAKRIEAEDGRTLVLWVDKSIQNILENRLSEGIRKYGAQEGSVVIMDPQTGGILGMVSFPSYHPQNFLSYEKTLYKNPIVASSYEPGSTFKALVMSAGIQEKVISPTTTMEEIGPLNVNEYAIRTWNNEYHGTINMTKVLERSSNVGMVFVAQKLGKESLLRYIRDFGFGQPTGIDVEEESSPALRDRKNWTEIDYATASFGQGIAVTPIQMVRAVGALANGGWIMEPHIVKEIIESRGRVLRIKPKKIRQVISPATSRIVTEMMVAAVDNGEAKWAKPSGYRIAGKTGTAQIPVAGHYDEKKTIASFVGFAPADNPKFVMLVTLREPTSSPWGSETAAPLFFTIARDLFRYFGITPGQ